MTKVNNECSQPIEHKLNMAYSHVLEKEEQVLLDHNTFQLLPYSEHAVPVINALRDTVLDEVAFWKRHKWLHPILLKDHATNQNICWATQNHTALGSGYQFDDVLTESLFSDENEGFIQPRSKKLLSVQKERTKNNAEVFTPSWIVDKQVSMVLEEFKAMSLEEFIKTTWMEITCGEAPYMANRYEMATGEMIPLDQRVGFIDRKFQRLNKEVTAEQSELWINHAIHLYEASYGYEYQGDSLLLARKNLLMTFVDNHTHHFGNMPSVHMLHTIADIISWNVFQMDGLTCAVPCGVSDDDGVMNDIYAVVKEWDTNDIVKMKDIGKDESNA